MSDAAQGPGWWQAADGKWYPPDQAPAPGWWRASDGNWYPPAEADAAVPADPASGATDAAPADAATPLEGATSTDAPATDAPATDAPTEVVPPATPPSPPAAPAAPAATGGSEGPAPEVAAAAALAGAPAIDGPVPGGPASTPAGGGKGSSGKVLVVLGIVVVLVLIAGLAVVLTRGGDPEVATDAPTTTAATEADSGSSGDDGSNGDEGSSDEGSSGDSVISDEMPSDDITLTDDVVVVNSERGSKFKGYSDDGTAMLLDASAENVDQLEAGKILLLSGITVVKVTGVDQTDDGVIVTGEPATLPEVIADGELEWDDISLDPETARLFFYDGAAAGGSDSGSSGDGTDGGITEDEILEEGGGGIVDGLGGSPMQADPTDDRARGVRAAPAAIAAPSKTVSGTIDEFSFDLSYEPSGGSGHHLNLVLTGTGDLAGTITIDVDLASLSSSGGATVEGRQVKNFDFELAELGGEAKISTQLQSTKQLTSVMTPPFLKVPFGIEFPALVGGIPFTLSISGTIQVQLSFALAGATLSGDAEITFGGDAGFHFKDGSLTVGGNRVQDAPDLLSKLQGGGGGPVGVVLTAELPKVGFGFGFLQTGAGVYLSSGMVASQTILPPPPACTSMQVAYVLAGGVEAKFLGKEFDLGRKAVVDKRWDYTVPKTAQCTAE